MLQCRTVAFFASNNKLIFLNKNTAIRVHNGGVALIRAIKTVYLQLPFMEQPIDIMLAQILKAFEPDAFLGDAEPFSIFGFFNGAVFHLNAIQADGHLQKAVFCQIDKVAVWDPPLALNLL